MNTRSLSRSLSLMEQVVLHNIQIYETFQEKIIYLENFYDRYFNYVFGKTNYITETYKSRFVNKVIFESRFDFNQHVKKIHEYIRKAVNFEYLNEQTMFQQGIISGNKDYVKRATQATHEFNLDEFFETIREGMTSTVGQISSSILGLIKPLGQAAVNVVWGALAIYDYYKFSLSKQVNFLGKFLTDLISIGLSFVPTPGQGTLISKLGKTTFSTIDEFVKFFILDPVGKTYVETASAFLGIISKIISSIIEGAEWVQEKLNLDWPLEIATKISDFITTLEKAFKAAGFQPTKGGKIPARDYQAATIDTSRPLVNPTLKFKKS